MGKIVMCEVCKSNDLIKKDDAFACNNCGMKYSLEEVQKMMVEADATSAFDPEALRNSKIGDIVNFDKYQWLVIDKAENKTMLITNDVLMKNGKVTRTPFHEKNKSVTWQHCSLRRWLNNEFFNSLGDTERSFILESNIPNNDSIESGVGGSANTWDRVFCLDTSEALNLMTKKQRAASGGWWLRTPGGRSDLHSVRAAEGSKSAADVAADGTVHELGWGVKFGDGCGIRPALWIDL